MNLVGLIGLIGISDDIARWGKLAKGIADVLNHEALRWTFVLAAIFVAVWVHDIHWRVLEKIRSVLVKQANPKQIQPTTSPPNAPAMPQVVAPNTPPLVVAVPVQNPAPHIKSFQERANIANVSSPSDLTDLMLVRRMILENKIPGLGPSHFPEPKQCPHCKGKGNLWGSYNDVCGLCNGTGELPGELNQFPECRPCKGSGRKNASYNEFCPQCNGYGVRIPNLGST